MDYLIPPRYRRLAYVISAVIGLLLTAVQVGYSAADAGQPVWLIVALAVYGFLAGALGLLAAANTRAAPLFDR